MGIQTGTIKGGVIENARLTGLNKEFEVKIDKAFIQKAILDRAVELISQIEGDELTDVDFTTCDLGGSFQVSLNIEFKNTEK
ncbi:hypothetical protein [Enterococcus malodoratus]|uniref:Uncharacterized protein n=1 Tax=Enterococcus malodoratus ATCC 43197 TaxID=1158601 RepID=R2P8W2_9ENTE|nr:hypothetical protein [Enterococcus malodoratus]EOH80732.1 hypothetical protein UAI_00772 [Enterococcus malodoratus ATCC 43197]EOT69241.1 hypothetical protein I585_00703 [Enterococcus malodoratus ATCC 43197]OJG57237.1 hypothetical protein RV07_GL003596 [Enterococcus malodoratus]SPW68310.1 Uncharacterised protein [Enterococcus malodoratus]STC71405.1 Uncharacterised protein [Enterococcus malodoratus]